MKVTVSVPDDLWVDASPADSNGPSDTVQRALHLLRDQLRAAQRPLANAPDQANLDRYRPIFDKAVATTAKSIETVLDNGYRFGLLLAPGLTPADFESIEEPDAGTEIKDLVFFWGEGGHPTFSSEFAAHVAEVLDACDSNEDPDLRSLLEEVLGGPENPSSGVVWTESPLDEDQVLPRLTDTYTDGVLAALKDVRDEATRQMTSQRSRNTESR